MNAVSLMPIYQVQNPRQAAQFFLTDKKCQAIQKAKANKPEIDTNEGEILGCATTSHEDIN